jgi:hypothetical protein
MVVPVEISLRDATPGIGARESGSNPRTEWGVTRLRDGAHQATVLRPSVREEWPLVESIDLLEDVAIAVLVASTAVATLDFRWRSRRRNDGGLRQGSIAKGGFETHSGPDHGLESIRAEAVRESMATWVRRLATEQARWVRHKTPASVVVVRVGDPQGALGRRASTEMSRNIEIARHLAGRSRASDTVRVTDDGMIRVLLTATTEDGAHSYADRISKALPSGHPIGEGSVVAAWASVRPTRDLPTADRLAVARLRGASGGWLRSLAVRRGNDTATARPPSPASAGSGGPGERPLD